MGSGAQTQDCGGRAKVSLLEATTAYSKLVIRPNGSTDRRKAYHRRDRLRVRQSRHRGLHLGKT